MKNLKIFKNKIWLLPIIILIIAIIIPAALAFYYRNVNSPLTTKFSIEDIDEVFITKAALNEMRRKALAMLKEKMVLKYRRNCKPL